MKCKYCENEYSDRGITYHERFCKENPNKSSLKPKSDKWHCSMKRKAENKTARNQYTKSAELNLPKPKNGNKNKKVWNSGKKDCFSADTIRKMSIAACNRIKKNSKYSKNVKYKGVILESSYELLFAQQLDEFDIKWIKCHGVRFPYTDVNGKERGYVPDFFLPDFGMYVDTKNDYLITKDRYKIDQVIRENNIDVRVYSLDDIVFKRILKDLPTVAHGEQGVL